MPKQLLVILIVGVGFLISLGLTAYFYAETRPQEVYYQENAWGTPEPVGEEFVPAYRATATAEAFSATATAQPTATPSATPTPPFIGVPQILP